MDWFLPWNFHREDGGQYMVEFALTFTIFIMFVTVVVDLGLMIYNHNLFYHATYRGARQASLGASNSEIAETVKSYAVDNYYPGLFMVARPTDQLQIEPSDEIDRVQGRTVRVSLETTFGFNLLAMQPITATLPVSSESLVHVQNDDDRDGQKDKLESNPKDHDNNGSVDALSFGGSDRDADDDGTDLPDDTVKVAYFDGVAVSGLGTYSGYAIERPNNTSVCADFVWPIASGRDWEKPPCFNGTYHAPEIWDNGRYAPSQLFPRKLPRKQVQQSSDTIFIRTLRTDRDSDNDGYIDKYDSEPINAKVQ